MIVVDFETEAIEQRPAYPPRPVGASVVMPGSRPRYYAWGHPTKNNCTEAKARDVLRGAWNSGDELLFHNGKFDVDVAETHLGMPRLEWRRYHDTMFLLFLQDPHAASLALKPAAARLLGMPAEEQEAVRDWLVEHGVVRRDQKDWGAYIAYAPGDLVGRYANGDTLRTIRLFRKVHREIVSRGMQEAYDRERRLMPKLLDNERGGIRVAVGRLARDVERYEEDLRTADAWLRRRLRCRDLNVDSDGELAEALAASGQVREFDATAGGKPSVSKKSLTPAKFKDRRVAQVLSYRSSLTTCLGTFARPWLEMARATGGTLHTSWNQVRGEGYGTRTGRPSTAKPSLLNVPKDFEKDRNDDYVHPAFIDVTPLPLMRRYLLPDRGGRWLHRDYNQQELRLLAHFEGDALCRAYNEDPDLDTHDFVRSEIARLVGRRLDRRPVKDLNFGYIYGMGLAALAAKMGVTKEEAKTLRNAQMAAVPGLKELSDDIRDIVAQGLPIVTWGGREYYVEQPKYVKKFDRVMSFEYKLINYLVQGSAADVTKEAVIRFDDAIPRSDARFLVTVYDELNASAAVGRWREVMETMRECMEAMDVDVFMLSDGKVGTSWGTLGKKLKEKR